MYARVTFQGKLSRKITVFTYGILLKTFSVQNVIFQCMTFKVNTCSMVKCLSNFLRKISAFLLKTFPVKNVIFQCMIFPGEYLFYFLWLLQENPCK